MSIPTTLLTITPALPLTCFVLCLLVLNLPSISVRQAWQCLKICTHAAWLLALLNLYWLVGSNITTLQFVIPDSAYLAADRLSASLMLLITILGAVIGTFSARYLQGEARQLTFIRYLTAVLACVLCVLLANHWAVLILAWTGSGLCLRKLLCFYDERPFARLALQKKTLADLIADALLIVAALLVWQQTGTSYFHNLEVSLPDNGTHPWMTLAAIFLALTVVFRTALMPVHGWLTQVMEAPTPVSALLHAGVVNLGGYVLIRLHPLLDAAAPARWMLVGFGLLSTVLAALVMLTRISIKVKLAWSTIAQMGFMVLECAMGLYTLAALHLLGHSLYKTYAFLAASSVVADTQQQRFYPQPHCQSYSLWLAPVLSLLVVPALLVLWQGSTAHSALPWWWGAVLALCWSPLLWLPQQSVRLWWQQMLSAAILLTTLTALIAWGHRIPLHIEDRPFHAAGVLCVMAMAISYVTLALLQYRPARLEPLRQWVYAGFYLDEFMTRLTLRLLPTQWAATTHNDSIRTVPSRSAP